MCWGMLGCGGHTDSQGQIIMPTPMFLHISFIFFHNFLSFPFFLIVLIVIFGLKESNRPTGWKFVLHRMQAAFFRCILLGLLSRAKLRATQTLQSASRCVEHVEHLGVEHVSWGTLEYLKRGWQHGSDNTIGLRPVHMSLLGSTRTWLSHAFQCFSLFQQKWEYAIPYLILRVTLRERHLIKIWLTCVSFVAIVWIILVVGKAHWNDLNHLESVSKDIPPGFSQDLFGEWSCQSANTLMGRSLELLLHHPLTFFSRETKRRLFL